MEDVKVEKIRSLQQVTYFVSHNEVGEEQNLKMDAINDFSIGNSSDFPDNA